MIVIYISVLTVVLIFALYCSLQIRTYFGNRTRLYALDDRFNQLVSSRREFIQHFFRAESEGQTDKAKRLEEQIVKIDEEIKEIREQFNCIQSGKTMPLKKL